MCTGAGVIQCAGGYCAITATDPNNCGMCGRRCPGGTACSSGVCVCGSGQTSCGGTGCVDLQTDVNHCGACGTACTQNQTCTAGMCACRPGFAKCGGTGCTIDTNADPNNCGSCGTKCSGATPVCVDGTCKATCPMTGYAQCNTLTCVNTNTDPSACGGCAQRCARDELCAAGRCSGFAPVASAGCSTCPCTTCDARLGFASCCTDPTYGAICLDRMQCP
jgi:hypothetical protein